MSAVDWISTIKETFMSSFNKKSIKAETALVAIQGAVAKAHQLGHKMSIVISDESGA